MKISKQKIKNLRLLIFFNSKTVRETIAWIVLFILATGFYAMYLQNRYENLCGTDCSFTNYIVYKNCIPHESATITTAIIAVLKTTLIYTLLLMLPIYINLQFFVKQILERRILRVLVYVPYVILVLLNSAIFAGVMHFVAAKFPEILTGEIRFWFNSLIITGTQLIATGLWYRRELVDRIRIHRKTLKERNLFKEKYDTLKKRLEVRGVKEFLKIGTTRHYWIIRIKDIRLLKGDGNEPKIFSDDEKGEYRGSTSLSDYLDFLPNDSFIQVHRSYIINKFKVLRRKGDNLIMKGKGEVIPIGNTFKHEVDKDEILGFLSQ